jgi:transposase
MWTAENRSLFNRDKLRYPSDLTDAEWRNIGPLLPPARRGGGKRRVDMREVVNGVMYVLSTGCQWRYMPKDLPPCPAWQRPATSLKKIISAVPTG